MDWIEKKWCRAAASIALAAILAPGPAAMAQSYPGKPIRLVVALAPGGAVDTVARLIAAEMSTRLGGQPIIVENRPGAGGNIGADYVAKSAPDGYTLLMGASNLVINAALHPKLPYNTATDFVPIALIGTVPTVMLASPQLPAKNFQEFLALARAKPGTLTYASGGTGSSEHLAGEILKSETGIDMLHVPYKGGGLAINDLMGNQVSVMFPNQLTAMPFIKSGKLRAFGVTTPQRSPELPDVPTFTELGVPKFRVAVWWGLLGPSGIPRAIVQKLNDTANAALASPNVKERLTRLQAQPLGGSVQEFATFYASEMSTWAQAVRESGATAE